MADVIQAARVYSHCKKPKLDLMKKLREKSVKLCSEGEIGWQECCKLGEGFGYDFGDEILFGVLEEKLFKSIGG